jgi:competence protein ComEA
MDEAAPWRALEDPAPAAREGSPAETSARSRPSIWVIAALGVAGVLVVVAFLLAASNSRGTIGVEGAGPAVADASGAPSDSFAARVESSGPSGKELIVDVQGAVVRPGVIHLPGGSRIGDAIAAAGGFGPRVAADRVGRELNLAALLRDGDQIMVPSRDDTAPAPGRAGPSKSSAPAAVGPLDLNRASASELDALPGIGPVTANKIVAAREEQPFATVEELRSRKIVGAATFDKIKDLVAVR